MFVDLKSISHEVDDLSSAKQWYETLLNCKPVFESPFAVIFHIGDASLSLVKGSSGISIDNSTTYWEVNSITDSFNRLVEMGAAVVTPVQIVMNITRAKLVDPFGNSIGIRSSVSAENERRVESESSETAMIVTFCRALAVLDQRPGLYGEDSLAYCFLLDHYKKAFKTRESQEWAKKKLTQIYGYVAARTKYGDKLFSSALEENIPQIVILGAGYDSRAYRFTDFVQNSSVFEVDIESTQRKKRELLEKNCIPEPSFLTYITMNFKSDSFLELLEKAGCDSSKKTLFIWEGVTPYLSPEAVQRTLISLREFGSCGSRIFFDYLTEERGSNIDAEPFLFWADRDKLASLLKSYSISEIESLNCSEIEQRYLIGENGDLVEKSLSYFSFLYGEIQ